ncbi:MAG: secretin N-terminal domain-containing protein [Candidatus Omnitrophota bacterium]
MKINKTLTSLWAIVFLINSLGANIGFVQAAPVSSEVSSDKISLDLKNVDIVELLRILSLKTGKTIVPGKDVSGRITVYLSNVAFDDVLDIIILTQGLALNRKDNVYYVMSEPEYRKNFGRAYGDQRKIETVKLNYAKPSVIFTALGQLKSDVGKIMVDETSGTIILIDIPEKLEVMDKAIKDLDRPLTTTVYDLNYMKAADAKAQFTAAVTQGTGEVIIDERSGKAIISDLPQKMQKMNMLVRELDEPSRQVYVEAEIVELTLTDEFERGIDWEKVFSQAAADGLTFAGYFPAVSDSIIADYQKISVGTIPANNYTAMLKFLGTFGRTSVISQPRISVVNEQEANVMVGVREAYVTSAVSQSTGSAITSETIEFIDVGVKLKLVPKIGADGFITMKIRPEVSSVLRRQALSANTTVPIIQTSQSETVVKVKDGMMIMLAGMTRIDEEDTIKGWPVLSKIPFLGALFGYRLKSKIRTEVIIFLTPHLSSGERGLRGDEITQIIPRMYLPENLQKQVDRDKAIDSELLVKEKPAPIFLTTKVEEQAVKAPVEQLIQPPVKEVVEEPVKPVAKPVIIKPKPIDLQAQKSAKDYYQKGLKAQTENKPQEAIDNFMHAIQLDDKYAAAYNSLGVVYEQESKLDKAEAAYQQALAAKENFGPAYANLALLNEGRKDYAKALEYWRKRVLYGDPNSEWTKQALKRVKELEK